MASKGERERLTGHALLGDESFRKWLLDDPVAAARSLGIELSGPEAKAIQATDAGTLEEAASLVHKLMSEPVQSGGW
jgi:hypothetical protein